MNLESNRGIKAESTRRKFRRRFFLAFLSFDTRYGSVNRVTQAPTCSNSSLNFAACFELIKLVYYHWPLIFSRSLRIYRIDHSP